MLALQLCDFSGVQTCIAKKPYFCNFSGEGGRTPVLPLDMRMFLGYDQLNSTTVLDFLQQARVTLCAGHFFSSFREIIAILYPRSITTDILVYVFCHFGVYLFFLKIFLVISLFNLFAWQYGRRKDKIMSRKKNEVTKKHQAK